MGRPLSFESIVPSPPPSASSAGTMDRDLLDGGTHVPACVGVERGAQFSGDGSLVAAAGGRAGDLKAGWLPRPVASGRNTGQACRWTAAPAVGT